MAMTESTPLLRTHKSAADGQLQSRAAIEHNDLRNKSTHNHAASYTHQPESLHKSHSHSTLSSSHDSSAIDDSPDTHHHHVPTNAFLSIGLQTSIAIALHKLPEGFITYATNHANPQLGASVFLALFIHNITEGFALALPLYLAMQNRFKAMLISFALGGLSQPLGAGIAALWFRLAGSSNWAPEEGVYGGMFAVTAGIMASVALQLFGESLELSHSKNLCFWGAFVGMAVMGISSALTA
jgi:ZIP family zinc transporter